MLTLFNNIRKGHNEFVENYKYLINIISFFTIIYIYLKIIYDNDEIFKSDGVKKFESFVIAPLFLLTLLNECFYQLNSLSKESFKEFKNVLLGLAAVATLSTPSTSIAFEKYTLKDILFALAGISTPSMALETHILSELLEYLEILLSPLTRMSESYSASYKGDQNPSSRISYDDVASTPKISLAEYSLFGKAVKSIISDWQEQKKHSAEAQDAWDNQFGLVPYQTPEEVLGIPKLRK